MPKFKIFFTCVEDPFVTIDAENEDDAWLQAEELYEDEDSKGFTYSGYFRPEEIHRIGE